MRQGIAFVISAPSGAGKSALVRGLLARVSGLAFSVSHTTRPPRAGEVDGVDYRFVDREAFERMIADGAFAEWAEVHRNLYGTSIRGLEEEMRAGRDVVLDIDVQGALQIAQRVEGAVSIFILPPSWDELRRRIETRGLDSPEAISQRLDAARVEVGEAERYQYLVVNEDFSRALDDLCAIVRAERCRETRNRGLLDLLMDALPQAYQQRAQASIGCK